MNESIEIPLGKRTKKYRFFEILPGMMSYLMLFLLVFLSWWNPIIAGIYLLVIIFTIIVKAIRLGIYTVRGYRLLEKAQKDYLDTRESILEEIDTLTKKRAEAERLYNLQKEKIKNIISRIDDFLELDDIDGKPKDIKKIQELRKELDRPEEVAKEKEEVVPEREKLHLEQPLAKTGTDSTISVSYITSRRAKPKKKDEDKLDDDKGKRIKRLSRIKRDNFL